jgi:hypothetical protein
MISGSSAVIALWSSPSASADFRRYGIACLHRLVDGICGLHFLRCLEGSLQQAPPKSPEEDQQVPLLLICGF